MIRKVALILLTLSVGGYMLVDGTRNVLTGTYFGPSLGPWSTLVRAVGIDPQHFGGVFVVLGLAWFAALAGLLARQWWGVGAASAVGVLTLWYLPVGTVLSAVYLAVVLTTSSRDKPAATHKI